MRTIYKYEVPVGGGDVKMPKGAEILSVGTQGGGLFLWAEVETSQPIVSRKIQVYGTGHDIHHSEFHGKRSFIGTAFMGPLVWHVYDAF